MQDQATALDDGFGHWLAGFIDGEGCFQIDILKKPYGWFVACRFTLALRRDDLPILEEAQRRTGLGVIRDFHTVRGKPGMRWGIHSKGECQGLVTILDRYPLRAKKQRDYQVWRQAVLLWVQLKREGRRHSSVAITILELAAALRAGREFEGSVVEEPKLDDDSQLRFPDEALGLLDGPDHRKWAESSR